ncbi:hypothetical protein JZ751_027943 [Albula glossodonta]|uniref:TGS domain-containing protein n=1 Tax=Albula glossodonta TaxID=121402 RepID=A0A8T2PJ30_9TELE|nr:hypothetical protein JZ751_027943 [Albula glossodonta]
MAQTALVGIDSSAERLCQYQLGPAPSLTAPPSPYRTPLTKGTKAPQAAGKIHTDFEKGFIMAEVMKFQDFKEEGSESAVKAAGKYRQQGRNYTVEDGDIIFFKFNTPNQPKKK